MKSVNRKLFSGRDNSVLVGAGEYARIFVSGKPRNIRLVARMHLIWSISQGNIAVFTITRQRIALLKK